LLLTTGELLAQVDTIAQIDLTEETAEGLGIACVAAARVIGRATREAVLQASWPASGERRTRRGGGGRPAPPRPIVTAMNRGREGSKRAAFERFRSAS
jgi:hypothetical protein